MRIRVARIVAAPPPISDAPGNGHHPVDVRGERARNGAIRDRHVGGEKDMHGRWGSDGEISERLFIAQVRGAIQHGLHSQL